MLLVLLRALPALDALQAVLLGAAALEDLEHGGGHELGLLTDRGARRSRPSWSSS